MKEESRGRLVGAAALLSAVVLVAEAVGGWWTGSLALLSDAGHMLTDVLALALSYVALRLARRPATPERTYGYLRIEILSALVNGSILIVVSGWIAFEALNRLRQPPAVRVEPMLAVAAIGLAANVACALLLQRAGGGLNIRGALLHVIGDALSSVAVVAGGLAMLATGWTRIDPVLACAIAAAIVWSALRLVREAVEVLLEAAPAHIDTDRVAGAIRAVPGVRDVHDLHIWSITPELPSLSGHVVVRRDTLPDSDRVLITIQQTLAEGFGLRHTTIQIESEEYAEKRSMVSLKR
jgi:cobalt-zinc-cadmium efflux system protein